MHLVGGRGQSVAAAPMRAVSELRTTVRVMNSGEATTMRGAFPDAIHDGRPLCSVASV